MKLVVDANILVSFFRQNPVKDLFKNAKSLNISLFVSEYTIKELKKNKSDILKYSGLNAVQFEKAISELVSLLKLLPDSSYKEFESEAKKLSPHDKDIPVFALALKLNCGIWSNELAFKKQSQIKVFSTRDMIELIS
ncbi:hypothetical protein J4233_01505 [Candidatus Pacearchaeota archaeon]|nr:hypothetical protein [Candidatus Pacearchaeota archaeon]